MISPLSDMGQKTRAKERLETSRDVVADIFDAFRQIDFGALFQTERIDKWFCENRRKLMGVNVAKLNSVDYYIGDTHPREFKQLLVELFVLMRRQVA